MKTSSDSDPRQGSALVITLCILVLITTLVIAFFGQSLLSRQVSFSSAGQERARLVGLAALDEIQGEMVSEMQAGSTVYPSPTPAPGTNGVPIVMRPVVVGATKVSPTMVPYHMIQPATDPASAAQAPNLVKYSTNGAAFYPSPSPASNNSNYTTTPASTPFVSTGILSSAPSANGRYVDQSRWAKPALNATDASHKPSYPTPAANPTAYIPRWVLLGRSGVVDPTTAIATLSNNAPGNASYAIGRFGYVVYDEGGLLDIAAAGYPSSVTATATANKGGQGYADLTQLGLTFAQSDKLIQWRNLNTASTASNYLNYLGSFAPQYGFIRAASGDNAFVGRQDFLQFWQKNVAATSSPGTDPSNDYLQYFTTFSREKNAPSWGPYLDASSMGGNNDGIYTTNNANYAQPYSKKYAYASNDQAYLSGSATPSTSTLPDINRFFPGVRVTTAFKRLNGEMAVVGEPLVKNRFDLSKLSWISHNSSSLATGVSATDIYNYFGLTPTSNPSDTPPDTWSWTYNHVSLTPPQWQAIVPTVHIMTLDEIAAAGREPDFFELLQAGILQGSLGLCDGAPSTTPASNTGEFNRYKNNNGQNPPLLRSDATPGNLVTAQESYQIMQIGANIVDQANTDGFPRDLVLNGEHFYGIENLPYVQSVADTSLRPAPSDTTTPTTMPALPHTDFQAYVYRWMTFALWNPHQNVFLPPPSSPTKITKVRLYAVSGAMYPALYGTLPNYNSDYPLPVPTYYGPGSGAPQWTKAAPAWISLDITDSVYGGFSEPVTLKYGHVSLTPDGIQSTQNADQQSYGQIQTQLGWSRAGFYIGWSYLPESPDLVSKCAPLEPEGQTPLTTHVNNRDPMTGKLVTTGTRDDTAYAPTILASIYPTVYLQYLDPGTSTWHTYQEMRNLYWWHGSGDAPSMETRDPEWGSSYWQGYISAHRAQTDQTGVGVPFTVIQDTWPNNAIDPRSQRFNLRCPINRTSTITFADTFKGRVDALQFSNPLNPYFQQHGTGGTGGSWNQYASEFVNNVNTDANIVYTDRDLIMRPGDADGWAGADPQPSGATAARPVMLNRPFRSVGELGFVSRDSAWKTLDCFSPVSADSALLDLFCVGPVPVTTPTPVPVSNQPPPNVVAGKLNINSSNATVLQTLVANVARTFPPAANSTVSATDAKTIATTIANNVKSTPLRSLGDLPSSMPGPSPAGAPVPISTGFPGNKIQREAVIRALADGSGTRTWNLLIDVIAQSGRYRPGATKLDTDFVVEGEKRCWLHVAIDRFTGEVVDKQLEPVSEQ